MYAQPPPVPASYVPSLPEGIDPSTMPPEIQDILRRRPDLLRQAMEQSNKNAAVLQSTTLQSIQEQEYGEGMVQKVRH